MKSMRDYINLVEAAMQESKNKQSYEHHRDMAKLDTGPGRKDIHNALANKYGKRMDDEKKTQKPQGVAEGLESEDMMANSLGKFAYYAITAKGKDEPQNPYPAGTQSAADFDEGYEAAYDGQTRNLLAAPVENLVRFYNVADRLQLLKQGAAEGLESEDPKAKTLGKFAYYAITAKGKDEPQNPYPAGTQSAADFDEGYEAAYDGQTRNLLAAPVENLVRFYNVADRLQLLKQGAAEEQLEETSPEAIAKIDQITRK